MSGLAAKTVDLQLMHRIDKLRTELHFAGIPVIPMALTR